MRITAILLSLYVCFLASMPLLAVIDVLPEVVCCLDVCTDEHEEQAEEDQDNCSELCNPFLSCQCSLGFTTPGSDQTLTLADANYGDYNGRLQLLFPSQVIFPVWHPPKV